MSEYDDLLDELEAKPDPKPAKEERPKRRQLKTKPKAKPKGMPNADAPPIRRGNERLVERQCSRWMFHEKGVYCKTCKRVW